MNLTHQPRSVWAVAFAAVIAFMGIGLVDPILPAISRELDATPSQAMLLFTSYLFITAIAMFFSSWVSSRLGTKRTLLVGLVLVVLFAALAGASDTVGQIIGFRAGWGLGNALFISTALAAIIASASGGTSGAIMLYEAALGLGIAIGPLLGGLLGDISWRGPFIGTAVLMAVGVASIVVLLPATPAPAPAERISLRTMTSAFRSAPLMALAGAAFLYNYAFFSLLAWSPFPLEKSAHAGGHTFGAHELGYVFFGWGLALALTSVLVAPRLTHRFGRLHTLRATWALLALDLLLLALSTSNLPGLIVGVVAGGALLGVVNTVMTEAVMEATDLPRSVASSTYSCLRFFGGAIAAWAAGELADAAGDGAPYVAAAVSVIGCIVVVTACRRLLTHVDEHLVEPAEVEALAVTAGDA